MSQCRKERITYKQESKTIDLSTGEVLVEDTITHTMQEREPNYIKLYLDTLLTFKDLSRSLNPILLEFLNHMSYANDEQLIFVNAYMKKNIGEKLNLTVKRIDQALSDFVKSNIFKRVARGTYQVNPHLFGRGEWKDIKKIRAEFDFNTGEVIATIKSVNEI